MHFQIDSNLPLNHPCNVLRLALNKEDYNGLPDKRILSELLFTAHESRVLDKYVDAETAILIWKIVELSKNVSPAQFNKMRK